MADPPGPPAPPSQPPPQSTPPPEGPQPPGFWRRHPKRTGALIALGALGAASLVDVLDGARRGVWPLPFLLMPVSVAGGTLAMFSGRARPYATGFVLTMGITLIVVGGVCVALLAAVSSV